MTTIICELKTHPNLEEKIFYIFYLKTIITLKRKISANAIPCQYCHILYMFKKYLITCLNFTF